MTKRKTRNGRSVEERKRRREERRACFGCKIPVEKCKGDYPRCQKLRAKYEEQEAKNE